MARPHSLVAELAGAIADGALIDWTSVDRESADSESSGAIANLKIIDQIGGLQRSAASHPRVRPAIRFDVVVLLVLAGFQIALALIGFASSPSAVGSVPGWLLSIAAVTFGVSGVVVALAGRWDSRTAPLACVLLCIASATAQPQIGRVVDLIPDSGLVLWIWAALLECFLPFFLWQFAQQYPRIVHLGRKGTWLVQMTRVSLLVGTTLFLLNLLERVIPAISYPDAFAAWVIRATTGGFWLMLFALALPAPLVVLARSRHADEDERRRVRFFVFAFAVGVLPLFIAVLAEVLIPPWAEVMRVPRNRVIGSFIVYGFLFTVPLTIAYGAVARRVLGIRVVIHRAARAALTRWALWLVCVAPWAATAVLAWRDRHLALAELFGSTEVIVLLSAGAIGLLAVVNRNRLLTGVDRVLLGRKLEPGIAMTSLTREMAIVRDASELEETISPLARDFLGCESCHLLIRQGDRRGFESSSQSIRCLHEESALVRLAEASPDPISIDARERKTWLRWLPESDRLWLADADIRLVVPVRDSEGACKAVVAFGPSRSGVVYPSGDVHLAGAIGSAVSMALENSEARIAESVRGSESHAEIVAGECRDCGQVSAPPAEVCSCGGELDPAAIPFVLNGKFQLKKMIGAGGMGIVYLAEDLALKRTVALKTLPRLRSDALLRLRREARSMASFVHPNLALIFGAETWRGIPVLVVEYLAGGTLASRLTRGELGFDDVMEIGIKLADALSALHQKGMLHRDVKPANIGFSEEGEPKLLDFGLAHLVESTQPHFLDSLELPERQGVEDGAERLTGTDHVVGTPFYLSPEVVTGAEPSIDQDLWSLCLVLWEAIVGFHPLRDDPIDKAMDRIAAGKIPDLRKSRPDCPDPLAAVVMCGLAPKVASRYRSANDLSEALRRAQTKMCD
ncbi:MAG: serine/threonine protein kinase [bacterium]|nr:serine/threonine protein kinase [bacterium]